MSVILSFLHNGTLGLTTLLTYCYVGFFLPTGVFNIAGLFSAESISFSTVVEVSGCTFCTGCSLSNQRAWQQDGEQPLLGRQEGSMMSWPLLESDHQQPFHTPLFFQCQQDIPSWDTRRFSCLVQRALLSAAFIWNAKRGATGGSVSPRIKGLLWRVPFLFLCVCVWVQTYS